MEPLGRPYRLILSRLVKVMLTIFVFFFVLSVGYTQDSARVLVRGQELPFQDFLLRNGTIYLFSGEKALPQVASLLGGNLIADPTDRKMIITTPNHTITVSESTFRLDEKEIALPDASLIVNNQWYLSLKAIGTALDANLSEDADRGIWYLDPYVRGISSTVSDTGVEIHMQSGAPVVPTISRVASPERIVADFPYAVLAKNPQIDELKKNPFVESIHLAQFQAKPSMVRMVITLATTNVRWDSKIDADTNQLIFSILSFTPPPIELPAQTASKETTTLTDIVLSAKHEEGEQLEALLKFSGSTAFSWHKLKAPDNRLYLDLTNCMQGLQKGFTVDSNLIDDIRISQFQRQPVPMVRIVFAMRNSYHTEVETTADGIKIRLTSSIEENPAVAEGSGVSGNAVPEPRKISARNGIVIALDPGHGGSDPGARGRHLVEKEVTLDIARRLRSLLLEDGFKVVMTRDGDYDVLGYHGSAKGELQARINAGANAGAMVFVSIHLNSSESGFPHGVATHWYKSIDLPLANSIQESLARTSGFQNRGIIRERFYVLRHSTVPAVLAEIGFLSNPEDERKLSDPNELETIAKALEEGLVEYTGTKRHG